MKSLIQKLLYFFSRAILKKYRPDIIGITGSVGKTSAREAMYSVLKNQFSVYRSEKNFNNELGVPFSIMGISENPGKSRMRWLIIFLRALWLLMYTHKKYPKVLILEMGADKPGDITYLTKLAPCTVGVITAISPAHLELFGDMETLAEEKKVMHLHLDDPQGKWAIYNEDDPLLSPIRESVHARPLSYGFSPRADITASELSDDIIFPSENGGLGGVHFTVAYQNESAHVELPHVISKQSVYSVLAGIAVGIAYGVPLTRIVDELREYESPPGRMRLLPGIKGTLLIDDSYNSSPLAARAALDVLAGIEIVESAKRIAVLGDMLELGAYTEDEHRKIGEYIIRLPIDMLVTVGSLAHIIADAAQEKGFDQNKILCFDNPILASVVLKDKMKRNDVILIKGSQGIRLEKIVKELMAEPLLAQKVLVRQGKEWK